MAKSRGPVKLTPEMTERVAKYIRAGNFIETASAASGIHKSTLYDWLKRGARERQRVAASATARVRKSEALYVAFSEAIEKAQAESEARDILLIGQAAKSDWKAAAWRLERKYPQRFGRTGRKSESDIEYEKKRMKLLDAQLEKTKIESEKLRSDHSGEDPEHVTIVEGFLSPDSDEALPEGADPDGNGGAE